MVYSVSLEIGNEGNQNLIPDWNDQTKVVMDGVLGTNDLI